MKSKNAKNLLKSRYCLPGENPKDVPKRIANALALSDSAFEKRLHSAMSNGYFLPNSPCIRNAGTKKAMLHACFVLPIEDDIRSIYGTKADAADIFRHGGGVGINFSPLRPVNAPLSRGGVTSGVVSFISEYDFMINNVKQGGFRRGAMMGILDYNHAEIVDFIRSKLSGKLTNLNISVMVNDDFMSKVETDEEIDLINPQNKSVWSTIKAKDLFDLICFSAYHSGDPGMLFYDRINKDNPHFPKVKIRCTNPCGEVPLMDYGACCLGSINISKFVKNNKFDGRNFEKHLVLATRALLNNNHISWFPLKQIDKIMKEHNPIGVGIMGFADCLIKLGLKYDSQETLDFIDEIGEIYKKVTDRKGKDCFYKRIIAPTGSLSLLADCSSGIEPIFDVDFERHLTHGVVRETREFYKSKYVRIAHDISPEWHLKVQAQWQKWVDGSISKTINAPANTSVRDIRDIYLNAWKLGCKGITVFRDSSKEGVLKKKPKAKCDGETCSL